MANNTTRSTPESKVQAQWHDSDLLDKNSDFLKPQVYQLFFKKYGRRLMNHYDFLDAVGHTINVDGQTMKAFEEEAGQRPIKIKSEIATGSAGADITAVMHSDNYDEDNNQVLRVGQIVMIPATYQPAGIMQSQPYYAVSNSTATLPGDTWVLRPYNASAQIATAIPAGTELILGSINYGVGGGQPDPLADSYSSRSFQSAIVAETVGFEGSYIAKEHYHQIPGTNKIFSDASMKASFRLDEHIDHQLGWGVPNGNTSTLVTTSITGASRPVKSTKGIYTWAEEESMKMYTDASLSEADFAEMEQLFESQLIRPGQVVGFVGSNFNRTFETFAKGYMKDNSTTDIYDKVNQKLGVDIRTFRIFGIDYVVQTMGSLANASSHGLHNGSNYVYEGPDSALFIPDVKVTLAKFGDKTNVTIPTFALGYVNNNGENRTRMVKDYRGVSGVFDDKTVATDKDGFKRYWKSEFMAIVGEVNKWIYMRKNK